MAKITLLAPDPADPSPYADPVFVWDNKDAPGQRYDVWVLPKGGDQLTAKPLYVAKDTGLFLSFFLPFNLLGITLLLPSSSSSGI